jgi:hypothetical protein
MTEYEYPDYDYKPDPELRAAAKRYHKIRSIRERVLMVVWLILGVIPWWFSFGRTDMLIWYVGMVILVRLELMWRHIRAVQLRLASMHDEIDRLSGKESEEHLLGEYTAD